jgi:NAD(P)-dependent dehydrogenase (short-subunit alcohol dehydrogenase family)
MDPSGRVVVVTGAASGVGKAEVELFAGLGAQVVAVDKDPRVVTDPSEGVAMSFACDVTDAEGITAMFGEITERLERVDVLINTAGWLCVGAPHESDERDWDMSFSVNAKGTWLMARAALPLMMAQGGGVIVNTASAAGLRPTSGTAVYSAAKAAVVSLTRSISIEYGDHNIRANCICPGLIDTPMGTETRDWRESRGEPLETLFESYSLKRIGTPQEMAEAVLFLVRHDYVTGIALPVDAGRTLH